MGDSGPATTTTTTGPPKEVIPYLIGDPKKGIPGLLPQAQAWYDSNQPAYFPGSTLAGLTPAQTQGIQSGVSRAQAGSPLNQAASGYLQGVLGGDYLNGGPGQDRLFESIQSRVTPAVSSNASLAGRTGSGAHEGVLTRELTNAYAPIALSRYMQERGLQQQAAGMAPQIAAQDYADINAGIGYGGMQQAQSQAEIDAAIAKHNFEQNKELAKLQALAGITYGYPGSTSTSSTQAPSPSIGQQIAGGLLTTSNIIGNIMPFRSGGVSAGGATGAGK
jgi:hypothetical protein